MGKENDPTYQGHQLTETISLKVIIGILLVYIVFPFLQYSEPDHYIEETQESIFMLGHSGGFEIPKLTEEGWNNTIYNFVEKKNDTNYHIIWMFLPNLLSEGHIKEIQTITGIDSHKQKGEWFQNENCSGSQIYDHKYCEFRFSEMELYQFNFSFEGIQVYSYVRLDIRQIRQIDSKYQFILVILTTGLLFLSSIYIGNDIERIMTKPIKKMVSMIIKLADDPLRTSSFINQQKENGTDKGVDTMDQVVVKIGKIIELGYGTMGAEALAENIDKQTGIPNIMVNGQKINTVVLVVKIEEFNTIANCLKEETTLFINALGNMVQECAEVWDGYLNHFETSTFLLTWKLPSFEDNEVTKKQEVAEDSAIRVSQALITSIKIFAEFKRSRVIKSFLRSSKLKQNFKDFNISIALNYGWSIEGVIGYSNRAEISYISPVIQEAILLSKYGNKIGFPILMTDDFYFLLTNKVKTYISAMGYFKWNNFKTPKVFLFIQGIYTFEINNISIEISTEDEKEPKLGELRPKDKFENTIIDMKDANSTTLDIVYDIDLDIEGLKGHNTGLSSEFREGLAAMLGKNWAKAIEIFKEFPSNWIIAKKYIEYMEKVITPDEDWDGSIDLRKLIL